MTGVQQVRRPLVGLVLAVGAGLYGQQTFGIAPLFFLSLSAFVLAAMAWKASRCPTGLIYLTCFFLAASYGAIEQVQTPQQSLLPIAGLGGAPSEIAGIVVSDPAGSMEEGSTSFLFHVDSVLWGDEWCTADSDLRVFTRKRTGPIGYGDRWWFRGQHRSYDGLSGGRSGSFSVNGDARRLRAAPASFKRLCYAARRRAIGAFELGMKDFPEYTQLIQALLLGYRNVLPAELYRTFSLTGTLHIFAISGLHVGVMASILIAALKLVGISKPRWGLFLIPLLFFYVVATGMKASAFRAFLMAAIYFIAPLFHRKPDSVSAIALSAILLLGVNPLQLGDPGFLLSFTVVSGIVMAHAFLVRQLHGYNRPVWMAPLAQQNGPNMRALMVRHVGLLMWTSLAAWVFSAPLTASFFNTISPAGLLGNLVIIPLTFMIVLTGCCTVGVALFSNSAVLIFNHANRVFSQGLILFIQQLKELPLAYAFIPSPSAAVMFIWYAGVVALLVGSRRARMPGILLMALSICLWGGGLAGLPNGIRGWRERASSVAFRLPEGQWILAIDGSPYNVSRTMRRLREDGINQLHALVLSGSKVDVDRVGELGRTFQAEQIWMHSSLRDTEVSGELQCGDAELRFAARAQWPVGAGIVAIETR